MDDSTTQLLDARCKQCDFCGSQASVGGTVLPRATMCAHFDDERSLSARVHRALSALYMMLAHEGRCPGFEPRSSGPDAYRAEDLPLGP